MTDSVKRFNLIVNELEYLFFFMPHLSIDNNQYSIINLTPSSPCIFGRLVSSSNVINVDVGVVAAQS